MQNIAELVESCPLLLVAVNALWRRSVLNHPEVRSLARVSALCFFASLLLCFFASLLLASADKQADIRPASSNLQHMFSDSTPSTPKIAL